MQTNRATMNGDSALYMFAIMPPPELSTAIHKKRIDFSRKYHFTYALKPPVHITMLAPFFVPAGNTTAFEKRASLIQRWACSQSPFPIELRDYRFFPNRNSPVVYIDVAKNEHLTKLHGGFIKEAKKHLAIKQESSSYKPHVTIGYRDIAHEALPAIEADYSQQSFSAAFECSSICLWRHNRINWQTVQEFQFKGMSGQLALF